MKQLCIFLCWCFCGVHLLSAQETSPLQGQVTDTMGKPLLGASVYLTEPNQTVATNAKGVFRFSTNSAEVNLRISFLGFQTKTLKLKRPFPPNFIIVLQEDQQMLELVTVKTGYQSITPGQLTGSAEVLTEQQINRATGLGIIDRLEGISTATLFDKRGNSPNISGANTNLLIRGLGSLSGPTEPLIVVDNFPFEGDINSIDPNEVVSVTILKDAAAAAIWGARAGNGVIVITTRRGRFEQALEVSFNQAYQVTSKPNLHAVPQLSSASFLEAEQFLFDKGYFNALENNFRMPALTPGVNALIANRKGSITEAQLQAQFADWRNIDVRDDFNRYVYRPATNQQYALSMSGGSSSQKFILSAGYDRYQQHLNSNDGDRLTLSAHQTLKPIKHLQISTGINYVRQNRNTNASRTVLGYGQLRQGNRGLYPYAQLTDSNGESSRFDRDYRNTSLDVIRKNNPFLLDWDFNPLDEIALANNQNQNTNLRLETGLVYRIFSFLNAEFKYQYQQEQSQGQDLYAIESYYARNLINLYTQQNGTTVTRNIPLGGINDRSISDLKSNNFRFQLNAEGTLATGHHLSGLLGAERRSTQVRTNGYRIYGFDGDILNSAAVNKNTIYPAFNNLSFSNYIPDNTFDDGTVNNFISYYGQLAYDFEKRYLLNLTARKDASNLFGVNINQKGTPLWSIGMGWNISQEAFYRLKTFSLLKLRLSYGSSGNVDNSRSAQTVLRYGSSNSNITNLPYADVLNPPNPDLRWERVNTLNIGLDFALKNQRLSGSFDIYQKRTSDLLAFEPVDPTTGFASATVNNASTKGRGWELTLTSINIPGKLNWGSQLLLSYNKTTVSAYDKNFIASSFVNTGGSVAPLTGYPVYPLFSYRNAGLDPLTGEPQGLLDGVLGKNYAAFGSSTNISDLVFHGSALPLYNGVIRNTLQYGTWSLSASLSFRLNYYFRRATINYASLATGNGHPDYDKRWKQPGDEVFTNIPAFIYPVNSQRDAFYGNSDAVVERGDNLRLQDIRISFSPKSTHIKWLPAKTEIFAFANNLGIIWRANKNKLDPDFGVSGIPPSATIAFGIRSTL